MTKLAIVPKKTELDMDFDAATQPPKIEIFEQQQQRQDPPELAALKRKQQQMCI